jgi:hypothetical protein
MTEPLNPPPMSPEPCEPGCPGWAVFWTGGADGHLYPDDTTEQARARRNIQQCDTCWDGRPEAPGDEVYQAHPACQAELGREIAKALAEVAEPPKAPEPRTLRAPSVHLNGSGRVELCKQLETAHTALESAREALGAARPHARDYYVQSPGAFELARAEHVSRLRAIEGVQGELMAIWQAVRNGQESAEVDNG